MHVTSNYAAKKLALAESNEDSNQWLDQFMPAGDIPQVPKVGSIEDDYYHFADAWVGKTTYVAIFYLRQYSLVAHTMCLQCVSYVNLVSINNT